MVGVVFYLKIQTLFWWKFKGLNKKFKSLFIIFFFLLFDKQIFLLYYIILEIFDRNVFRKMINNE